MTAALVNGGKQHFGWGVDRHMRADLFDALNVNTKATGNFRKPPTFPLWPRPSHKQADAPKKKVSVRDLYRRFT
jgi:hypothetical protein